MVPHTFVLNCATRLIGNKRESIEGEKKTACGVASLIDQFVQDNKVVKRLPCSPEQVQEVQWGHEDVAQVFCITRVWKVIKIFKAEMN
jgi:hypothetical protein